MELFFVLKTKLVGAQIEKHFHHDDSEAVDVDLVSFPLEIDMLIEPFWGSIGKRLVRYTLFRRRSGQVAVQNVCVGQVPKLRHKILGYHKAVRFDVEMRHMDVLCKE